MKIGNTAATPGVHPVSPTQADPDQGQSVQGRPGSSATEATETSTTVQISREAAELLESSVDNNFDAEKVEQVRQAIAKGEYKINAEAIADKLLANAQELLGRINSQR